MNKSSGKSRHALKYLLSGLLSGYHDVNTRVIYHFTFRKIIKWAFMKTVSYGGVEGPYEKILICSDK